MDHWLLSIRFAFIRLTLFTYTTLIDVCQKRSGCTAILIDALTSGFVMSIDCAGSLFQQALEY